MEWKVISLAVLVAWVVLLVMNLVEIGWAVVFASDFPDEISGLVSVLSAGWFAYVKSNRRQWTHALLAIVALYVSIFVIMGLIALLVLLLS